MIEILFQMYSKRVQNTCQVLRTLFILCRAISNAVLLRQLLKERQRTFDRLRFDAVGRAEVSGAAEVRAGDEQEVVLLGTLAEGIVVRLQRPREEVERALRLDTREARAHESLVEHRAVLLVRRYIRGQPRAARDDELPQRWRIHMREDARRTCDSTVDTRKVGRLIGHDDVADALSCKRE